MNRRNLLRQLLSGNISAEEFTLCLKWLNGAIIGLLSGDQVTYNDPISGEKKTATRADFERLAKKYFALLADVVNPCEPVTSESQIRDDI